MKRFGYLHDRLFWISSAAYVLNRLVVKPHLYAFRDSNLHFLSSFLHSHFNDLLLLPAALPVVLWLQRLTGLRQNDRPPSWTEMFFHLGIWSLMCKVVGPFWLKIGTVDPLDLIAFTAGGVIACLWWNYPKENPVLRGHEL